MIVLCLLLGCMVCPLLGGCAILYWVVALCPLLGGCAMSFTWSVRPLRELSYSTVHYHVQISCNFVRANPQVFPDLPPSLDTHRDSTTLGELTVVDVISFGGP